MRSFLLGARWLPIIDCLCMAAFSRLTSRSLEISVRVFCWWTLSFWIWPDLYWTYWATEL